MRWIQSTEAQKLANATGPTYVGPLADQPFPHNPLFRSQPVLSDVSRDLIYDKVVTRGDTLKAVSAEFGIDIRRVAAVVRLKELEKQYKTEGKPLALPYAKAILGMLPKTFLTEGQKAPPHEAINEVLVDGRTKKQLFVPVSESRVFTREDAAESFGDNIQTVDRRSPHRQLIDMERAILQGSTRAESLEAFVEATQAEEEKMAARMEKERVTAEKRLTKHKSDRFEFRIKDFNSETVGEDGRSRRGTGWRYGVPLDDRKKGAVKIPTQVPERS